MSKKIEYRDQECSAMKKLLTILCAISVLFSIAACGNNIAEVPEQIENSQNSEPKISDTSDTSSKTNVTEEEADMLKIEIIAGNKTFSATLYDNEATKTLIDMLPLTLNMSELNGNEKYYYLDTSLPTKASRPSGIKTGDIMLYGNSCLVLFYESFSTSYSYTPIGHIDDPTGLAAALGTGSVQVTFRKG